MIAPSTNVLTRTHGGEEGNDDDDVVYITHGAAAAISVEGVQAVAEAVA